jgi:hypothetical protein
MVPADELAILYSPGARGDFLAAVLLGEFTTYNHLVVPTPRFYKKIHTIPESEFKSQYTMPVEQIGQYTSIRIKLSDLDDVLNVVYFCRVKLPQQLFGGVDDTLSYLVKQELLFRQFDAQFDHVVEFKDLFDIESIRQLYSRINQQALSDESVSRICHNIELQTRVNQLNYTEYFCEDLDLDQLATSL